MSRIKPVTLEEFKLLLKLAQEHHYSLNEPIPEINENQYDKIRSCLETPFQTFGGKQLYKGFLEKAAILFYLINKNHALVNGNKRMACFTLAYFSDKNGYEFKLPPEKLYNLAMVVTKSDPTDKDLVIKHIKTAIIIVTDD